MNTKIVDINVITNMDVGDKFKLRRKTKDNETREYMVVYDSIHKGLCAVDLSTGSIDHISNDDFWSRINFGLHISMNNLVDSINNVIFSKRQYLFLVYEGEEGENNE